MSWAMTVRVSYPLKKGRISLRVSEDPNRLIAPLEVSRDGQCFEYLVESEKPYFYFRPVLQVGRKEPVCSVGADYLAVPDVKRPTHVFPYFSENTTCSVSDLTQARSDAMGSEFGIRVFVPPGYDENTLKRYPVLYMQDGHNLFFREEAAFGEHWRIAETLSLLDEMNVIENVIVVGIRPNEREVEYTRPGYEKYGLFMAHELKPLIDSLYRTLPGPEHTAVMGSSLGGVVSFYLGWQHPGIFGMAGCMSSTFSWKDNLIERVLNEPKRKTRFYLDSGWPSDNYEVTRTMRSVLHSKGFQDGVDLLYFAFPNALHSEKHWALRTHLPFQFFFGNVATAPRPVIGRAR